MSEAAAISRAFPGSRKLFLWYGLCAGICLFVLASAYLQIKYRQQPLQKYRSLPDFQLVDQDGRSFGLGDLKGKVWLADFVYTTCPGPCPMVTRNVSQLQDAAFQSGDVRFVTFTMDPKDDSPAVLKQYGEKFHATPGKWIFLTGDPEKIFSLVRNGFTLAIADATPNAPIVHSTKLALVDRDGTVRGYYDGIGEVPSEQILRDIQRLLHE